MQEYTSLGTAGGIYHFRDRILAGDPDSFFVMNGDVCAQFPLQEMVDFAAESVCGMHDSMMFHSVPRLQCCINLHNSKY